MGSRNRVGIGLSYRPARLQRLAESIPGLLKILKYHHCSKVLHKKTDFWPFVPDGELQRGGAVPNPATEGGRQHGQRQLGPRPDQGANQRNPLIFKLRNQPFKDSRTGLICILRRCVFSSKISAFDMF